MTTTWKTVRVFISSTFRDMQAERDHLVRFVFPRLREQLLPRRIHLVDVDLRWGVTEEQSERFHDPKYLYTLSDDERREMVERDIPDDVREFPFGNTIRLPEPRLP